PVASTVILVATSLHRAHSPPFILSHYDTATPYSHTLSLHDALPISLYHTKFSIQADFIPKRVWSMVSGEAVDFIAEEGYIRFELEKVEEFEGMVMER